MIANMPGCDLNFGAIGRVEAATDPGDRSGQGTDGQQVANIFGGAGNDSLAGTIGVDSIVGSGGDDTLFALAAGAVEFGRRRGRKVINIVPVPAPVA